MSKPVRVDIWSDVQCVWCYLGESRWRSAIEQFDGEVEVNYRSFELQPGAPVDFDAAEFLATMQGMDPAAQEQAHNQMRQVADAAGVPYAPERIRPTNSHLALELLHHAASVGRHEETLDRLFAAYHAEGRHIGTIDSLVTLAEEVGLDPAEARVALEAGTYVDAVDADSAAASALGVRGVPFAVVNNTYAVPGALETSQLVSLLQRAAA